MLLSILALYLIHARATGAYTFDYTQLLGTKISPATAMWLMLGFFIAFAVKLPPCLFIPGCRTPTRSAYGGQRNPCRPPPENRRLRSDSLRCAAVLRGRPQLCTGRHGPGSSLDSLRRAPGLRADRSKKDDRLFERQPHGVCSARGFCMEQVGALRGGHADPVSWNQHGSALLFLRAVCRKGFIRGTSAAWAGYGRRCPEWEAP